MKITNEILFQDITNLACKMLDNGAEGAVAVREAVLACENHGFSEVEFSVSMDSFHGIAKDKDGKLCHSFTTLSSSEMNYTLLTEYSRLLYRFSKKEVSPEDLRKETQGISENCYGGELGNYLFMPMVGVGFTVMFSGGFKDAIVALIACLLIAFIGGLIKKVNENLFLYNALLSLTVGIFVAVCYSFGLCENPYSIVAGIVMLIISALGIVDGMWSMLMGSFAFGTKKIVNSLMGALGIAIGSATPLIIFRMPVSEGYALPDSFAVTLISCTIACVGLGFIFKVEKKAMICVAMGSALCWCAYSLCIALSLSDFLAVTISVIVTGIFSFASAVCTKKNMLSICTISVFPLVPGAEFFYMMYGIVAKNYDLALNYAMSLLSVCSSFILAFSIFQLALNIIQKVKPELRSAGNIEKD